MDGQVRDQGDAVAGWLIDTRPCAAVYWRSHSGVHRPIACSGGGAGGPGHPSNSACPPGTGGHGGGFIMIAALELVNEGSIMSGGNNGFPDRNYCNWPNGNPQVGSGGGGAGGFIKWVATATRLRCCILHDASSNSECLSLTTWN